MAKKQTKSSFADRIGSKGEEAHSEVKDAPVKITGDLPAGIDDGVAKLSECYFGEDKKGNNFFRAAGVVLSPETFAGERLVGRTTSIYEILEDTPKREGKKTFKDHLDWVENELKKLGLPVSELEFEEIEDAMKELVGVVFKFQTWKSDPSNQYPNPQTNHKWMGVIEDYDEEAGEEEVEDETEETEEEVEGDIEEEEEEIEEGEIEEEVEDDDWQPEKEDIYFYKPKGKRKLIECEVTQVFVKQNTVTLLNNDDRKTQYKGVPWSSLKARMKNEVRRGGYLNMEV